MGVALRRGVMLRFPSDIGPIFLSVLSFLISIPFALSSADYIGLLHSYLLSLITPIVDQPLCYLVADPLSSYQWQCSYPVRYIGPQSSVTVVCSCIGFALPSLYITNSTLRSPQRPPCILFLAMDLASLTSYVGSG